MNNALHFDDSGFITGTIEVVIALQTEVISSTSLSNSFYDLGVAILVDGQLLDARTILGNFD